MKSGIVNLILFGAFLFAGSGTVLAFPLDSSDGLNLDTVKTETFKVYGNCGMCESRIEGALKGVKGIKKADWDRETKMMQVTFNDKWITLDEIKMKIAGVGYDTEEFRATDEAYHNLPGCCQYDRPQK